MKMSKPSSGLALPTEKSKPVEDLGKYSILLYGEEKVGKTSLTAEFPENLGLMFEPGAKALSMYQVEISGWKAFKDYLDLLDKSDRFKTLTIDTIDVAYQMCLKWVCEEEGFDHPADEAYGKGWNKVSSEFTSQINRLLKLRRGVIFTSHAAERDIKTRLGEEYTKIVPTMANGARGVCQALVDIWIYMSHQKDTRTMRIRGSDHIAAGHRLQQNFVGVEEIPAGKDAATAYKNLVAAFNNKLEQPAKPKLSLKK